MASKQPHHPAFIHGLLVLVAATLLVPVTVFSQAEEIKDLESTVEAGRHSVDASATEAPGSEMQPPTDTSTGEPGRRSVAGASGQIVEIYKNSGRALVTFPGSSSDITSGTTITVSSEGEACEGRVTESKGNRFMVAFEDCSVLKSLKAGHPVAVSDFQNRSGRTQDPDSGAASRPSPIEAPQPKSPKYFRGAVVALYDSAGELQFNEAKFTTLGTTTNEDVHYQTEGAFGLAAEAVYMAPRNWGFFAGLAYMLPRKVKSVEVNEVASAALQDSELQITYLYANAAYMWDQIYIPFGFNVSIPRWKNSPAALGEISPAGGLQVGIGMMVTENLGLEALLGGTSIRAEQTSFGSSAVTDFGTGSLAGFTFRTKWVF